MITLVDIWRKRLLLWIAAISENRKAKNWKIFQKGINKFGVVERHATPLTTSDERTGNHFAIQQSESCASRRRGGGGERSSSIGSWISWLDRAFLELSVPTDSGRLLFHSRRISVPHFLFSQRAVSLFFFPIRSYFFLDFWASEEEDESGACDERGELYNLHRS